jgi:hypothetical protein
VRRRCLDLSRSRRAGGQGGRGLDMGTSSIRLKIVFTRRVNINSILHTPRIPFLETKGELHGEHVKTELLD